MAGLIDYAALADGAGGSPAPSGVAVLRLDRTARSLIWTSTAPLGHGWAATYSESLLVAPSTLRGVGVTEYVARIEALLVELCISDAPGDRTRENATRYEEALRLAREHLALLVADGR